MTQDIIEMARQAGFEIDCCSLDWHKRITAFANLVAAKEREACAKVVEEIESRCIAEDVDDPPLNYVASAIRARGEQA
jgi:hypothetical protein